MPNHTAPKRHDTATVAVKVKKRKKPRLGVLNDEDEQFPMPVSEAT
jgi:hypothetical protein